jgi:DNA-binding transcriptional ArsR family regulator
LVLFASWASTTLHELRDTLRFVERSPAPSLLPIFRSTQQAELLAALLGDPGLEASVSDLARLVDVPYPSVHREIERAETAGLVTSRRIGNVRLVRANVDSPYYAGLADVLTKAFGVPAVLAHALTRIDGIGEAFVYGSWASRHAGEQGKRPIGDIDVLVLGSPDRDELYKALQRAEERLGRPVQVTIRAADWLTRGEGSFHDTVTSRTMVPIALHGATSGS